MWLRTAFCISFLSLVALSLQAAPIVRKSLSPDQSASIEVRCKDEMEQECSIFGESKQKGLIKITDGVRTPSVTWHSNSLAEIRISCGSPCFYSWFFSPEQGASAPIEFVVAVAPTKQIAVRAGMEELEIVRIFGDIKKPILTVKRDFAPAATLVLVLREAKFTDENHLQITYVAKGDDSSQVPNPNVIVRRTTGKKGVTVEKTETVPLNIQ
jgi:hypothetical protein